MWELLLTAAIVAGLVYFIHTAGKTSAIAETARNSLDSISKASKARDRVESADVARRLLLERAVQDVSDVQDSKNDNK